MHNLPSGWCMTTCFFVCVRGLSCLTLCNSMDCSLPGSSLHGIFKARILEWVAISYSRGSSQPSDRTRLLRVYPTLAGGFFTIAPPGKPHILLWWPGKSCYSLAGKFWLICCIHQIVHHCIFIYFGLYKILLMEKIAVPWKNIKGTWNSSLLKKIKSLGKPELWHCLKMAEGSGTKQWLCCSIKLLVKMKNVFYFYLKSKELSGQPNVSEEQTLEKFERINYILMCDLL